MPRRDWARVQITGCGICGSDLHLFSHNIGPAPSLTAMSYALPFVLGHELAGVVVEPGPDCALAEHQEAVRTALDRKGRGAIKVVFRP